MTQADLAQSLIDSTNAFIYIKDADGRFLLVNNRAAEAFQASKEEIIGKNDYDFVSKEEADMFRGYDCQVAEANRPMMFKATVRLPDGEHTVTDHKFPVTDIEGSPGAVGGIAFEDQ